MNINKKHVLVVDDEKSWRDIVALRLTQLGCTVDQADNACDARDLLESKKYDLVVCDNNMGAANAGVSLLAWIRTGSGNTDVPFILHTGDDGESIPKVLSQFNGTYCYKQDGTLRETLAKALAPKKAEAA